MTGTAFIALLYLFTGPQLAFGPLVLLAPLTLIGLIVLPLIWWLLRVTPPKPRLQTFPPLRILAQITSDEETPNSTPLWLLLFRILLICLIAFALARPFITRPDSNAAKPLTLIIDNGWDAAPFWPQMIKETENRLAQARRDNLPVQIVLSEAPSAVDQTLTETGPDMNASDGLRFIKTLRPRALPSDRSAALAQLSGVELKARDVVWLSSDIGFDTGPEDELMEQIAKAGSALRLAPPPENLPILPGELSESAAGFRSVWHRTNSASLLTRDITARAPDGSVLARHSLTFRPGETRAEIELELPAQMRRKAGQISAGGPGTAGSVKLLDDSWGRPLIGVLSAGTQSGSPLLSEPFYAAKALEPYADIYEGQTNDLLALNPGIIIMPDTARDISDEVRDYVEKGGLLIRFAGPRLAKRPDDFLPVTLREGGRALGGALTWEEPQQIAPFSTDSPFYGLNIPSDVLIKRQVMAEPGAQTDANTWARLEDGSPIVTSSERGFGRIVLFHVTAGPQWSNLPLGGLYVDMLRRLLPMASAAHVQIDRSAGDWAADRVLTGYGRLTTPGPQVRPIANEDFDSVDISALHPPGIYRQGVRRGALNAVSNIENIHALKKRAGITVGKYGETRQQTLEGLLLALALILLALDALFALIVSGRRFRLWPDGFKLSRKAFNRKKSSSAAALALSLCALGATLAPHARAQTASADQRITDATELHLAYIKTGESGADWLSELAMKGVMRDLTQRTTIEPAGVRGVDPETDPLELYPLLYWPIDRGAQALSDKAAARLNRFMASGGTIIFDTQDAGDAGLRVGAAHPGLKAVTEKLDIPNLAQVPDDHVLTKSFYLLDVFPGRWANGPLWVDRDINGTARDGVSSVIIGSNDWAAAWAVDGQGEEVIETLERDIPRQREMARRFGVNLVMYALAGNYKSDQIHSAALIERIGQRDKKREIENLLGETGSDD